MATEFIDYHKSDRIVTLTMRRPETRNAIADADDCAALVDALRAAEADGEVSALILTGDGSAFSAGGNLAGMRDRNGIGPLATPADTRTNYRRHVQSIPRTMIDLELPMIAAVNGHAIGLGLDLACLCDIRVASASAKFAASFIKLGIVPGDGGAWLLPKIVGYAKAAELILTGDTIDAERAQSIGLMDHVVPAEQVLDTAREIAGRIAANPPRTVRLAKRLLREGQASGLDAMLQMSAAFQALAHETADHREALDAFLDKRSARFTGA